MHLSSAAPRCLLAAALLAPPALRAQDPPAVPVDSVRVDSARVDSVRVDSVRADTVPVDSVPADWAAVERRPSPPAGPPLPPQSALSVRTLSLVGGADEEAARVAQLRGAASAAGFLLRAPSSLTPRSGGVRSLALLTPEVLLAWNTGAPFSMNDGALWAGKGGSTLITAGLAFQAGPVRLILAPEIAYSANAGFDTLVPPRWRQGTEVFLPDWQSGEHSIDLPYRMGSGRVFELRAGQSSLGMETGPVEFGLATENEWWGPGIRNAIVLSNQAPGFWHLFARTARPLRTPLGDVEARWLAGALHDTPWYAAARGRGIRRWRSLSAAALVVSPRPTVQLGIARSVMSPSGGPGKAMFSRGLSVFTRWAEEGDPADADRFEQITSLFGRLLMPSEGAEVYFEWARTRLPINLRDLLEAPEHSQGYTLGLQWLRPLGSGELRLQGESTYLEESATFVSRTPGSWYASNTIKQGYTHDGQVVGASVGPGGSQQWLAVDWLRGRGRAGVFLSRVRWADDAYYDKPEGPNLYFGHDVSVFGGIRGAMATRRGLRVEAEYALERRWNIFFQNWVRSFTDRSLAVNVTNHMLRLRFSAAAPRLGR